MRSNLQRRRLTTAATGMTVLCSRLSFLYATLSNSSERLGKRQLVAVWIGHVEIAFSQRGMSWNLWVKSASAAACKDHEAADDAVIHQNRSEASGSTADSP
jgi:hypothetical protein